MFRQKKKNAIWYTIFLKKKIYLIEVLFKMVTFDIWDIITYVALKKDNRRNRVSLLRPWASKRVITEYFF